MRNQRARNKNKTFALPGSDAEQAATSKRNGITSDPPHQQQND
jgi:hypothetical protein